MSNNENDAARYAALRRQAESALKGKDIEQAPLDEAEVHSLIQELRIAQVELELQNEELRESQSELEVSRNRFRTLFHAAPVGYVILDKIGMIRQTNDLFCSMVRRTTDYLHQRSLRSQVAPDHQQAFDRRFTALLQSRTPHVIETQFVTGDGEQRLDARLEGIRVDGIPGDRGEEYRLLVAVSDITEAKSLEKQLWESQKLEAVGRLAGGIAHDFNNALTIIQGTVDVARFDLDPGSRQDDYLRQIEGATAHASSLVQQLLAFAHKGVAAPRVLDLAETLGPSRAMLARLLPESIDLQWTLDADLDAVRIDPVQLDQVLTNLVINARDAIGVRGTIALHGSNVTLDTRDCQGSNHARPGAHVALSVRDDGAGMDRTTLEQVFEPFFTTKPRGEGSGLGLSTVYGIVAQNHGLIKVVSEPGGGSCFTVFLPRAEPSLIRQSDQAAASEAKGGKELILLVEDNAEIVALTRRLLMRHGYQVEAFTDPNDAVTWFDSSDKLPDLLISDVVMPSLSGPALVELLTARDPSLRYMFISGYPRDEISSSSLRDSDTVFVAKPFDALSLLAAVRSILDQK